MLKRDNYSTLAKRMQAFQGKPGVATIIQNGGSVPDITNDTDTGVYYGSAWGIYGGSEDESDRLQTALNEIGDWGGGRLVVRARIPTNKIVLRKLNSIYYSDVHLEFRSPQILGKVGGVRVMGSMVEFVRNTTNGGKLDINADEGTRILKLAVSLTSMQADDFIVGDYIVVRGLNRFDGNSIQKQYFFVTAINTVDNELTVHSELEFTFQPTYTTGDAPIDHSDYGPDATTGTVIKVVRSGQILVDVTRGMYEFEIGTISNFTVGMIVRLADTRNEVEMNSAAIRGTFLPYENECNMEFARIIKITPTTGDNGIVTLDHAVSKNYLEGDPYYGSISACNMVENSTISGIDATYDEIQDSKNYHAVTVSFGFNCQVKDGHINGYGYRRGQGVRFSDSYVCKGKNILVEGGLFDGPNPAAPGSGSGENYGITDYKSTGTILEGCIAKDCRHGYLVQASTFFTIRFCQSWGAFISDFDLHGVLEVDGLLENCLAIGGNQHTPDSSDHIGFQPGNTSHVVGSHHITFRNCIAVGYKDPNGAGFAYCPNSTNIEFNTCQAYDCFWGMTFRRNSYQCLPVQECVNVRVINCTFYDCIDRAFRVIGAPVTVGTSSVGKIRGLTVKLCQTVRCGRHYVIDGNDGVENLLMFGNDVLDPVALSGEHVYDIKDILGINTFRANGAIGGNKGMRLERVINATVTSNVLQPTVESVPFTDGTGNTGLAYVDVFASGGGGGPFTSVDITDFAEAAQDSVGAILVDSSTIDFTYTDATPSITASIIDGSIASVKLANMAQATVKGRAISAGTGVPTDLTASELAAIVYSVAPSVTGNILVSNTTPEIGMYETDGIGVNNSRYSWVVSGGILRLRMRGDSVGLSDIIQVHGDDLVALEIELLANLLSLTGNATIDGVGTFGGNLVVTNTQPELLFIETDAPTDEKRYRIVTAGGDFFIQTVTDLGVATANILSSTRAGTTVSSLALYAAAIGLNGNTTITGSLNVSGGITGSLTGNLSVANTTPKLGVTETDAAADNQTWEWVASGGIYRLRLVGTVDVEAFKVTRSGTTPTLMELIATNINATGIFNTSAQIIAAGSIATSGDIAFQGSATNYLISLPAGSSGINSGHGRNLIITGGSSDNTAGKKGGDITLRGGVPSSPATQYGDLFLNDNGGRLLAMYDTDRIGWIGRGAFGGVFSDAMSISHLDNSNANDYCLVQTQTGSSHLNSKSGQSTVFSIGGVDVASVINTGLSIVGNLSVNGNFGSWTSVTYGSGWADANVDNTPGQYRKFGDLVFVRGLVQRTGGVSNMTVFTLPSGYRPVKDTDFVTYTRTSPSSTAVNKLGRIVIDSSSGNVTLIDEFPAYYGTDDIDFMIINFPPFSVL